MKYGRVLTCKDLEEAKKLIDRKVVISDYLYSIAECPEERYKAVLYRIKSSDIYPFKTNGGDYQFIREIIEEEPQLMTNRQLAEWLARGNGEYTGKESILALTSYYYSQSEQNAHVPDITRIRTWDSEEWVIPTVDIYERDCKGGGK